MAKPVRLDDATFGDWAERQVPLTLVLVGSRACDQSVALEPVLEDIGEQFAGQMRVATLDWDESREVAKKHQVEGVPTLLLLKDGERVGVLARCNVAVADVQELVSRSAPGSA